LVPRIPAGPGGRNFSGKALYNGLHPRIYLKTNRKIHYKKKGLGVAFDIGTTTIAAAAVNLSDGKVLGTGSLPNPQARWGADVLSRIQAIKNAPELLQKLSESVAGALSSLIRELGVKSVTEITAAGNPVMEQILLKISPEGLSRPPYRPAFKNARTVEAKDIGIDAGEDTPFYVFPIIGGFVGGDAAAVALALGLDKKGCVLAIDIGTNSEILLGVSGALYAASAAAGPAFEAGEIRCGMTAQNGAIQGVRFEGDSLALDVIGRAPAKGICGSGLIDAVAGLIRSGVIDPSGRIKDRSEVPTNLSTRIREEKGGNSFVLYRGSSGEVSLSQEDIRALQVAKSAIKAGITLLLKKAGVKHGDVQRVYVAGAFGSNLKKEGLAAIGLLEPGWEMEAAGDAALDGAILALVSDEEKERAEEIARAVKYVSLSGSAHFQEEFIKGMNF